MNDVPETPRFADKLGEYVHSDDSPYSSLEEAAEDDYAEAFDRLLARA